MIRSTANEKVRLVRRLHRRAARWRERLVIAEGARLIQEILRTGARPVLSFCTEEGRKDSRAWPLLEAQDRPPLLTDSAVMKAMSDTVSPPGLLAVFALPSLPAPPQATSVLLLDQVREPGNVGTILRSAVAAGVDVALLTPGCADAFSPKALRAAMGAQFRLPIEQNLSWNTVRALLGERQIVLADPRAATAYDAIDWTQPSALILGGEARGASRKASALADVRVAIPMAADVESLNTAVAAGIILFELARQRRRGGLRDHTE